MRHLVKLTILIGMQIPLWGCGGTDNMSRSDSFNESDSVGSSMFSLSPIHSLVDGNFRIRVISTGVSSGFVKLNDHEILGPSDFHNRSFDQTTGITLEDNNTIEYEIRGKPGDQLCVRVFELNDDDSERGIYEGCIDRTAGPPNGVEVVITPTPTP